MVVSAGMLVFSRECRGSACDPRLPSPSSAAEYQPRQDMSFENIHR